MLFMPGRAYDKYALFIKQCNGDWTLFADGEYGREKIICTIFI